MRIAIEVLGREFEQLSILERFHLMNQAGRDIHAFAGRELEFFDGRAVGGFLDSHLQAAAAKEERFRLKLVKMERALLALVDFQDLSAIVLVVGDPDLATPTLANDFYRLACSAHRVLPFRYRLELYLRESMTTNGTVAASASRNLSASNAWPSTRCTAVTSDARKLSGGFIDSFNLVDLFISVSPDALDRCHYFCRPTSTFHISPPPDPLVERSTLTRAALLPTMQAGPLPASHFALGLRLPKNTSLKYAQEPVPPHSLFGLLLMSAFMLAPFV